MITYYVSRTNKTFPVEGNNDIVRVRLLKQGNLGAASDIIQQHDFSTKLAAEAFKPGHNILMTRSSTRYIIESQFDTLPLFGYFDTAEDLAGSLVIKQWFGLYIDDPKTNNFPPKVIQNLLSESGIVKNFHVRGSGHLGRIFVHSKSENEITLAAFVLRSQGLLIKEA